MSAPLHKQRVFIVVPAYNEQQAIVPVVQELLALGYRVVVVDDGSTVTLGPLLRGLPLHLLRHEVNLGQGAALQTGIEFSLSHQAEYIVTFDADGQHQAKDITRLLQVLVEADVDIVLGSRFMEGADHNMPLGRRWPGPDGRWSGRNARISGSSETSFIRSARSRISHLT